MVGVWLGFRAWRHGGSGLGDGWVCQDAAGDMHVRVSLQIAASRLGIEIVAAGGEIGDRRPYASLSFPYPLSLPRWFRPPGFVDVPFSLKRSWAHLPSIMFAWISFCISRRGGLINHVGSRVYMGSCR